MREPRQGEAIVLMGEGVRILEREGQTWHGSHLYGIYTNVVNGIAAANRIGAAHHGGMAVGCDGPNPDIRDHEIHFACADGASLTLTIWTLDA